MTRTEAIRRLSIYAPTLQAMGATALYLFGSTNRDEARVGSDLDMFTDYGFFDGVM